MKKHCIFLLILILLLSCHSAIAQPRRSSQPVEKKSSDYDRIVLAINGSYESNAYNHNDVGLFISEMANIRIVSRFGISQFFGFSDHDQQSYLVGISCYITTKLLSSIQIGVDHRYHYYEYYDYGGYVDEIHSESYYLDEALLGLAFMYKINDKVYVTLTMCIWDGANRPGLGLGIGF